MHGQQNVKMFTINFEYLRTSIIRDLVASRNSYVCCILKDIIFSNNDRNEGDQKSYTI